MTKVVITGASGLLGRALVTEFKENGFVVHGFVKNRVSDGLRSVDLLDSATLISELNQLAPDVIIHSAAIRFTDKVEGDPVVARKVNVDATAVIADVADKLKAQLLYISTDYVFDGESAPYKEDDPPNPVNLYGKTKLDGEKGNPLTLPRYIEDCPGSLVLRVPLLYGPVEFLAESAVTVLLDCLLKPPPGGSTLSDIEVRYPSHVRDIAAICRQLINKKREGRPEVSGVFQWSGEQALTRYAMALEMAAELGLAADHVTAGRAPPPAGARRPLDCRMDVTRLRQLGVREHTPFRQGVRQCLLPWVDKRSGDA